MTTKATRGTATTAFLRRQNHHSHMFPRPQLNLEPKVTKHAHSRTAPFCLDACCIAHRQGIMSWPKVVATLPPPIQPAVTAARKIGWTTNLPSNTRCCMTRTLQTQPKHCNTYSDLTLAPQRVSVNNTCKCKKKHLMTRERIEDKQQLPCAAVYRIMSDTPCKMQQPCQLALCVTLLSPIQSKC